jgi:hypothetical protein
MEVRGIVLRERPDLANKLALDAETADNDYPSAIDYCRADPLD